MPLLDDELLGEQRRMQKTGDIRLGVKVPDKSKNGFHPAAISTFRFTSDSEYAIRRVADQMGGRPAEWVPDGRQAGWEVVTERNVVAVLVPPQQVITQDYEMWRKNTLVRRCDSRNTLVPGGPCQCPHAEDPSDADEVRRCALLRDEMAGKGEACSRYTRLNVQIPSLPDIGVWRLVTGGFWAAGELAMKAETLRMAREAGAILPAVLRIQQRQRPARPGETGRKYVVPVLELLHSVHEILSGQIPESLPAAMNALLDRAAPVISLETAPTRHAIAAGSAAPPVPATEPPPPPDEPEEDWQRATRIYQRALAAATARQLTACKDEAGREGLLEEHVCTDREHDVWTPLEEALRDAWRAKGRAGAA